MSKAPIKYGTVLMNSGYRDFEAWVGSKPETS